MPVDDTIEPRSGEELDRRALETWLLGHVRGARGPLRIRQFPHGFSNLNYLLELGPQQLVLRRAPPGANAQRVHDMGREYRLLASLHPAWGKVPEPVACCPDAAVIGAPFHVARRMPGMILRRELPRGMAPEVLEVRLLNVRRVGQHYCAEIASGWSGVYRTVKAMIHHQRHPPSVVYVGVTQDYRIEHPRIERQVAVERIGFLAPSLIKAGIENQLHAGSFEHVHRAGHLTRGTVKCESECRGGHETPSREWGVGSG